jgi:hypothetical protein
MTDHPLRDHLRRLAMDLDIVETLECLQPGTYAMDIIDRTGTFDHPQVEPRADQGVSIYLTPQKVLHITLLKASERRPSPNVKTNVAPTHRSGHG